MILLRHTLKSDYRGDVLSYVTLKTFLMRDMENTSSTCWGNVYGSCITTDSIACLKIMNKQVYSLTYSYAIVALIIGPHENIGH